MNGFIDIPIIEFQSAQVFRHEVHGIVHHNAEGDPEYHRHCLIHFTHKESPDTEHNGSGERVGNDADNTQLPGTQR